MEHFDEEIMKTRKKVKAAEEARFQAETVEEEKKQSIYDEYIEIYQIPTRFKEHIVLEGKASIRMPVDFELRPKEDIKMIYPSGNPPQELYGNSYSYFTVAFNWTEHQMTPENIPDFMPFAKGIMERMGPKAKVIRTDILSKEEGTMGIMELVANAFQGVSYSYIFYTILEGRLLITNIQFNKKYLERLLPVAEEIAASFLRIEEGGEEE